ncbi:MAG: right-handed parallel beta-helix repeat-containing protein [Planctomycetota bacterium]|nr:MAG: right-handed parallel beta-helix repeat-containing protein [Planctomycetota bacterium]
MRKFQPLAFLALSISLAFFSINCGGRSDGTTYVLLPTSTNTATGTATGTGTGTGTATGTGTGTGTATGTGTDTGTATGTGTGTGTGTSTDTLIVTIGPNGSMPEGGDPDYATIGAAESNIVSDSVLSSKDLISQNRNVIYKLYGEWEESVDVAGWTCNATYKLTIENGSSTRPTVYTADSVTDSYTLRISSNYIDVSGIHIKAFSMDTSYDQNRALKIDGTYLTVTDCILGSSAANGAYNYACDLADNVTIDNCWITGYNGIGDETDSIDNVIIRNCVFKEGLSGSSGSNYNAAIYIKYANQVEIYNNKIIETGYKKYSIYLDYYDDCKIYNNIIRRTREDGAYPTYGGITLFTQAAGNTDSYVLNNTIDVDYQVIAGDRSGIYLMSYGNGLTHIRNNIIYMRLIGYGFDFESSSGFPGAITLDNNCGYLATTATYWGTCYLGFQDNLADWITLTALDGASVEADPLFISTDPASADFLHISGASPCIGQGKNFTSIFTTDIDGEARPSSGGWCIGADER